MTRKYLILAIMIVASLFLASKAVWEVWINHMGKMENNANCTFYNEEDYAEQLRYAETMPVPEPVNPFTVRVTFDLNGLSPNVSRMIFSHGTPPIEPPLYDSVEYIGPFQETMDFVLSDTRNQWPFLFHPAITLYYDDARAVCFWDSGEVAKYIQNGRGHPHFKLELLPYRRVDVMSGYNLQLIQ